PDKLLTVGLALLVHRGLPAAPAERAPLELDIARPLLFVVGSRHWLRRVLAGGVCLVLLGWLVVPALVFMGYSVAVARAARLGETGLPGWSAPWRKLVEGAQITAAMALWYLPALVLGLPAEVWTDAGGSGVPGGIVGALGVAASLWSLVVLLLLAPIWSQYLDGGFRAAFDLA